MNIWPCPVNHVIVRTLIFEHCMNQCQTVPMLFFGKLRGPHAREAAVQVHQKICWLAATIGLIQAGSLHSQYILKADASAVRREDLTLFAALKFACICYYVYSWSVWAATLHTIFTFFNGCPLIRNLHLLLVCITHTTAARGPRHCVDMPKREVAVLQLRQSLVWSVFFKHGGSIWQDGEWVRWFCRDLQLQEWICARSHGRHERWRMQKRHFETWKQAITEDLCEMTMELYGQEVASDVEYSQ